MKTIVTSADLDPWLIQLAFTRPADAPVVSVYTGAADSACLNELSALSSGMADFQSDDLQVAHARGMVERYLQSQPTPGAASLAMFARAGERPYFYAAVLPEALTRPTVTVGDQPHLYQLARMRRNAGRFLLAACEGRRVRLLGVEFGKVVLDVRSPEDDAAQALLLEHYLETHRYEHVVFYGPPEFAARVRIALPRALDGKVAGAWAGNPHDSIAAMLERTAPIARERDRRQRLGPVLRTLLREPGRIARGPLDVLRAVNEGRAASVILVDGGHARGGAPEESANERSQWENGVREVLISTAIRRRIPWETVDDASSVPELDPFTCVLTGAGGGDAGEPELDRELVAAHR